MSHRSPAQPLMRRTSRRRLLATGAIAATAATAWLGAACRGGNGKRAATATPGTPRAGGTLRTAVTLPLSSGLDPHIEIGTGLAIFPSVYGYLLHVDPNNDTTLLDHAFLVEQPDPLTLVLRLRNDARFHDIAPINGRAVTAEDAARSIERYRDNPLVLNKTWHTKVLERVEAVDDTTLRITTRTPNVYSLSELGGISGGAIIPRELIDSASDITRAGVGSGPFRIDSADIDQSIRLARNDAYVHAPLPYLDAMEWTIYPDDARIRALKQREADVTPNRDRGEALEVAAADAAIDVTSELSLAYLSFGLKVDRPPFSDPRVRRAIDIALDRGAMIRDIAFGEGDVLGPVNAHIGDGYWSLSRDEVVAAQGGEQRPERQAEARDVIERAQAGAGRIRLQVAKVPQLLDVATVVRDQLQRVGLTIDLETLDLLTWYLNFRRGDFEMTLISQFPYESPDAPTRLYHSAGVDGTRNPFGFADPQIDALVERSWTEGERDQRRRTLIEAQRLMVDARPMIQLFTNKAYTSAWRYVRGRRSGVSGSTAQYNYEQWIDT